MKPIFKQSIASCSDDHDCKCCDVYSSGEYDDESSESSYSTSTTSSNSLTSTSSSSSKVTSNTDETNSTCSCDRNCRHGRQSNRHKNVHRSYHKHHHQKRAAKSELNWMDHFTNREGILFYIKHIDNELYENIKLNSTFKTKEEKFKKR